MQQIGLFQTRHPRTRNQERDPRTRAAPSGRRTDRRRSGRRGRYRAFAGGLYAFDLGRWWWPRRNEEPGRDSAQGHAQPVTDTDTDTDTDTGTLPDGNFDRSGAQR